MLTEPSGGSASKGGTLGFFLLIVFYGSVPMGDGAKVAGDLLGCLSHAYRYLEGGCQEE